MLTDQFLNICCVCLLSDNKKCESIAGSIKETIEFYNKTLKGEIPVDLKQKFDLIKVLSNLRISGKKQESIIDSIKTGKFESFGSFLKLQSERELTEATIDDFCNQINMKKKFAKVSKEFAKLNDFVDNFNTNAFDSMEVALEQYEDLISNLYVDMATTNRQEQVTKISSLDFRGDDYGSVLNQLESNYSGRNTVTTGYKELDKNMSGGYNPTRLYVVAGSSGDGKSTFLLNCLKNAVENDTPDPDGKMNVYAFVTLENLLDESFLRLYTSWAKANYYKLTKNIQNERPEMVKFFKNKMQHFNSTIEMDYFPPGTISVFDLRLYIQKLKEKYKGTGRLRAVYIDYLDLVKSGSTFDLYRLELGQVALMLKTVAVLEDIPIITVTQLNREGYDKGTFSLVQMSESIKKVEHSDFVALLKNQDEEVQQAGSFCDLDIFIGKNRSGPKNVKVVLRSKFDQFLIEDGIKKAGLTFQTIDNPIADSFI